VDATLPQRKRTTKEHSLERDLEKEMWTAGYKYSWRKMKAAAQKRAEDDSDSLCSNGSDKAQVSQVDGNQICI